MRGSVPTLAIPVLGPRGGERWVPRLHHHRRSDRRPDRRVARGPARRRSGLRRIYRDVQPRLLRYATVLVGRDAAEDVTAEAWLQISRDLHKFVGDADRFRGWAATIVHHRAMDVCRAGARRPTTALPDDERDEPVGASDTAAVALDALSTDLALTLIATLPREQAQAVLLRAVVGLDARTAGRCWASGRVRSGSPPTAGSRSSPDSFATTPRKAGGPLSDLTLDTDWRVTGIAGRALRVTRCTPDDSAG